MNHYFSKWSYVFVSLTPRYLPVYQGAHLFDNSIIKVDPVSQVGVIEERGVMPAVVGNKPDQE